MRLNFIIGNIVALAVSVMLLASCDAVIDTPLGECPEEEETVTISFRMLTSFPQSRADDNGHGEVDSELTEIEDGIDMNDFGMFVFAKMKDSAGEEVLLARLANNRFYNAQNQYQPTAPSLFDKFGAIGDYTVILRYGKQELANLLGISNINPNDNRLITFRVLILANSVTTFGGTSGTPGNTQSTWNNVCRQGTTFSKVMETLGTWDYNFSYFYNASAVNSGAETASEIYGDVKKNIPMFGTNVFDVTQLDLYESSPEKRVYLGEIELLRGLSKVRVVDNIQDKDADGYPKIVSAYFIGSKTMGMVLPANAVNYKNGTQVHSANIYHAQEDLSAVDGYKLGIIADKYNMTPEAQRKGDTFIGYMLEQKIGYVNNNVENILPRYNITVAYKNDEGEIITVDRVVNMRMSLNESENFVLRNHVYTLSINGFALPSTNVTVDYTVCPMNNFTADIPTFE